MSPDDLKAWRTSTGFSQAEAATALGIAKGSLADHEAGAQGEDGRPVEIPATIELACKIVLLRRAVDTSDGSILSRDPELVQLILAAAPLIGRLGDCDCE